MSDIFDHELDAFESEMDQLEEGLPFTGGLFKDDYEGEPEEDIEVTYNDDDEEEL
jgi:hypothetical protein